MSRAGVDTRVTIDAHTNGSITHTAVGALAVRQTGPDTVHLVGTAAGPLDGDELNVAIRVRRGRRLRVRTAAASVVLAGASRYEWQLSVADGGQLDLSPEPTVITGAAVHRTRTSVVLAVGAVLHLVERVQLGRTRELHGRWFSELEVDQGGRPLLRHRVGLGPGEPLHETLGPVCAGALTSVLRVPDERPSRVRGDSVRMALARGGTLTTELRRRL